MDYVCYSFFYELHSRGNETQKNQISANINTSNPASDPACDPVLTENVLFNWKAGRLHCDLITTKRKN